MEVDAIINDNSVKTAAFDEWYEDDIHIPPSTELIPDEYEHKDNKKGLVLIFHSQFDNTNKNILVQEFSRQGYDVSNVFKLDTKNSVLDKLSAVAKADNEDKTCLVVFFLGNAEKEDTFLLDDDDNHVLVKDVWSNFTSDNCPSLRNKPKIIIFQASKKPTTHTFDGRVLVAPKGAYNVPSEADMLLVYKRVENQLNRNIFMTEFCKQMQSLGKRDDIISLVTRTVLKERRPLIISTLTRKFYMTFNEQRGHYYDLLVNHRKIISSLGNLHDTVSARASHDSRRSSHLMQVDSGKKKSLKPASKTGPEQQRPPWRR